MDNNALYGSFREGCKDVVPKVGSSVAVRGVVCRFCLCAEKSGGVSSPV